MRSARAAEWILSLVLPPGRAASTVGDWLEDAKHRGTLWFWSCVLRTVFSRIGSDFAESPLFLVRLGLRGWLYSLWLLVGTAFGLFVPVCMLVALSMLIGFLASQFNWRPSLPFHIPTQLLEALIAQAWFGWCEFQAGRWIARRAPGRELAAGIAACLAPWVVSLPLGLLVMHFWGAELERYAASHPVQPGSVPTTLPAEIFLLAGILWYRHKSLRSVVP